MSIGTYLELKTAVASWMAKSNLTSQIGDFITLASTRIYYGSTDSTMPSDPVRMPEMQARETPTLSSGSFALPARYLETIRIQSSQGNVYSTLDYVSQSAFADYESRSDYATVYTVLNGAIQFRGTNSTIVHDYYAKFADFSTDADTNALLQQAPGVWLWGAVIEASIYQKDDAEAQRAYRMFVSAVRGINRTLRNGVFSSLAMRVR